MTYDYTVGGLVQYYVMRLLCVDVKINVIINIIML